MGFQAKKRKTENTGIDLVAFISLLSVCICFLLLTTIWVQIGSMSVKQAVGGQAASESKPKPELWVVYEAGGRLQFSLKNAPRKMVRQVAASPLEGVEGKPDVEGLATFVTSLKGDYSDISMALIRPTKATLFEDIISVMDTFRANGINDLGVTPL